MAQRVAYLCGEYPRATDTFIRREIEALRRCVVVVETVSVRRPNQSEAGTDELESERRRTFYVIPCSPWRLLSDHLSCLLRHPVRYARSLLKAFRIRSPGLRALLYQLFYFAEAGLVASHLRRRKVEHIHNHAPDASGYVTMLAAGLGSFTYSLTLHGFGILSEPNRWRLTEKIEGAELVICVSSYAKSQAMLWSDEACWHRLHVVHCGIDSKVGPTREHAGQGKRLLFVGRLCHVKGLPLLIDAFERLLQDDPELHLDLVGDGPDRDIITRLLAERGIAARVTCWGYLTQEQLFERHADADVFVMTSFAEGIPVVLMEAMAAGLPVVAPRITGIPELVEHGECGFLTVPGDVDSIVKQVRRLLADPALRTRFGSAGQLKVRQEFNLKTECARLASLMAESTQSPVTVPAPSGESKMTVQQTA